MKGREVERSRQLLRHLQEDLRRRTLRRGRHQRPARFEDVLTVAVVVELASMPDLAGFQHALEKDGVVLAGGQPDQEVATAVTEASGQGGVYVDRLQALPAPLQGLQFWLVADNVRQGAAKNSVHLLKNWIKDFKY